MPRKPVENARDEQDAPSRKAGGVFLCRRDPYRDALRVGEPSDTPPVKEVVEGVTVAIAYTISRIAMKA